MSKSIWFQPFTLEDFKDFSVNMHKDLEIEITDICTDYLRTKLSNNNDTN